MRDHLSGLSEAQYKLRHRCMTTVALLHKTVSCQAIGLSFAFVTQLKRRIRAESEPALLARTDGPTDLNNRRRLDEMLDQESHRARRNHSIFSLLFVDIDRFKVYNDTYGHQAGDDVIATIAKYIGDSIRRPGDISARYGGEEFIVVLPDTSLEGASCIAEDIRAVVSQLSVEHCGSEFGYITVSIGCAAWVPEHDADVASVIRSADEALYRAKTTGHNKVVVFTNSPTQQVADFRGTTQSHSQSLI